MNSKMYCWYVNDENNSSTFFASFFIFIQIFKFMTKQIITNEYVKSVHEQNNVFITWFCFVLSRGTKKELKNENTK